MIYFMLVTKKSPISLCSQLRDIENELRVRQWHRESLTGHMPSADSLHPREKYLARRQHELQELVDMYSGQMAYRPDPSQVSV